MSEKPKKRVVNKREYIALMMQRIVLMNALIPASLLLGLSIVGFCGAILVTIAGIQDLGEGLLNSGIFACIAAPSYLLARYVHKRESSVERVTLLNKHTAVLLPPEETLVRASDSPPSHQQAELLRAAHPGQEMPPEELLRATPGNRDSKP